MVTGDNVNTATSIALKCGIIKPGDNFLVLESKDFNQKINDVNGNFSRQQFDEIWPRLRVLARSSPQDKYVLVNGILESKLNPNREVVAVTGMLNIFIFSSCISIFFKSKAMVQMTVQH